MIVDSSDKRLRSFWAFSKDEKCFNYYKIVILPHWFSFWLRTWHPVGLSYPPVQTIPGLEVGRVMCFSRYPPKLMTVSRSRCRSWSALGIFPSMSILNGQSPFVWREPVEFFVFLEVVESWPGPFFALLLMLICQVLGWTASIGPSWLFITVGHLWKCSSCLVSPYFYIHT